MATTTKCFICKDNGNFDLKVCNDGKRHRICGSCYDLCQDNYIVILDSGVAATIADKETFITVKVTDNDNINNVIVDIDLNVPTAELEHKIQWFTENTITRFVEKAGKTNVRITVTTWQNHRFQCPVFELDHADMLNAYSWYAEQYAKDMYTNFAVSSPSHKYGKGFVHPTTLEMDSDNYLINKKDLPCIRYYVKGVYYATFIRTYEACTENAKQGHNPVNCSFSQPPKKVRTEQGKSMVSSATSGEEIVFSDNGVQLAGVFLRDEAIQGGVVVALESGNIIGVHYHNIIEIAPKRLTHLERVAVNKELVKTVKPGDIVTHWQGGEQVKSSFISANDVYVLATSSYGDEETIGYLQIISFEPGTPSPDSTPENSRYFAQLLPFTGKPSYCYEYGKKLASSANVGDIVTYRVGVIDFTGTFERVNDDNASITINDVNTLIPVKIVNFDLITTITPASEQILPVQEKENGENIPVKTFEDDKITPDSTEQIADLEALTPEVHTHQLLSLPGYPATEDDEGENIPVKTFKSGKSKQIAEQIRKNALKNTSRFLALLVVGFLTCCLAGVINSGVTHAQTACTVHKYAHKAGYYQRGYGTTTFYASPPSGCTVYNGPSDNASSVVSTSTPASTQTSTSTPSTTKHAKKSSQGHKKHTSKKHASSTINTHQSCKYTFDDSDTGTHKRSCNGTQVIIKITD